jgi:hypothetical protein
MLPFAVALVIRLTAAALNGVPCLLKVILHVGRAEVSKRILIPH